MFNPIGSYTPGTPNTLFTNRFLDKKFSAPTSSASSSGAPTEMPKIQRTTNMVLQSTEELLQRDVVRYTPEQLLNSTSDMSNSCAYKSPNGQKTIVVLSAVEVTEPVVANQVSGQTSAGSKVSVQTMLPPIASLADKNNATFYYKITAEAKDGTSFDLDVHENVRVHETDAGYSVFYETSNITRHFALDGSFTEEAGDSLPADGDSIYVLLDDNASLNTGDGNNTIIICGDNTSVSAGAGNNSIILADSISGVNIQADGGNNTLSAHTLYGGSINLGNGDNSITVHALHETKVNLGDGNNSITVHDLHEAQLSLGNGNNSITANDLHGAQLSIGNGSNSLAAHLLTGNSQINAGNGNNIFDINHLAGSSKINAGNGNNQLQVETIGFMDSIYGKGTTDLHTLQGSAISLGHGENQINIQRMLGDSMLSVGDGNNLVNIYNLGQQKTVMEEGSSGKLLLGDGNNTVNLVYMYFDSQVSFGNGNNTVSAHQLGNNSSMAFGDGDNTMQCINIVHNAQLSFGKGENMVVVDAMYGSPHLQMGAGSALIKERLHNSTVNNKNGQTYSGSGLSIKDKTELQQRIALAGKDLISPEMLADALQYMWA